VEGRSSRCWTDQDAALDKLQESGVDRALIYDSVPKTLAQLEKMLGTAKFKELVGEFVTKPQGKPTGVHPVAGAALVGEPSVDGQDHLVRLGGVVEGLVLVAQPEQLLLAVALADVHAERDELLVHDILEGIRRGGVGRALDGHGSLVVGVGGRTPRTIALIHAQQHPAIHADISTTGTA